MSPYPAASLPALTIAEMAKQTLIRPVARFEGLPGADPEDRTHAAHELSGPNIAHAILTTTELVDALHSNRDAA